MVSGFLAFFLVGGFSALLGFGAAEQLFSLVGGASSGNESSVSAFEESVFLVLTLLDTGVAAI